MAGKAARPAKPVRQRLAPEARAELILQQALRLFADQHYSAVSVRDIAEACGINVGLIYYYYENKARLMQRVLEHTLAELHRRYDAGQGLSAAEELKAWLRMHAALAPMLVRMAKIMFDYSASQPKDAVIGKLIAGFYQKEQMFLETCLARGIAQGEFTVVDVTKTARLFSLQLDGIFYAVQARSDGQIKNDIEVLCALVDSPALSRKR